MASAEGGTLQEADHFGGAAKKHDDRAKNWRRATFGAAVLLLAYASIVFINPNILSEALPASQYPEAIQRGLSKLLVFATLSYGVYMCARNFLAHEHNAIVNRHRQNALLTYKALAEAAHNVADKDTILTHAAACIFAPQPTGYTKDTSEGLVLPPSNSIVGLVKETTKE